MPPTYPAKRARHPVRTFGFILGLCTLGGIGTTGGLWAVGSIDLPFLKRAAEGESTPLVPPPGTIAVPLSATAIPAYGKVTREHLWNAKKGFLNVAYLPRDEVVAAEILTDLKLILGRVLSHDKPTGYAFTAKDFLPEGTRPGMTAGVPPGMRSFVLETSKVRGLHLLKAGDRFGLIGTLPVEDKASAPGRRGGLTVSGLGLSEPNEKKTKQAVVKVLVEEGVVVSPLAVRPHARDPEAPPAKGNREKPVEEVTVAVAPGEVMPLSEALALKAEITCVACSGRKGEPRVERLPAPPPAEKKVIAVEFLRGKDREVILFPSLGKPQLLGEAEEHE